MQKRVRFSIYLILTLSSFFFEATVRPAFTRERRPSTSLTRSLKNSGRQRGKTVKRPAQEKQEVKGELQIAVKSATVNFTELARKEALAPDTPQTLRFIPEPENEDEEEARERPVPDDAQVFRQEAASPAPEPLGPSPALASSFQAMQATTATPPDTQGAVGPNHVMAAVNGGLLVQSKTGSNLVLSSLVGLFSGVLINSPADVFDPRLQYDPYGNRWILVAVADRNSASSAILVGVSQTSDPTGIWNIYRIDADSADLSWADFPMIGFNKDWIVVSANMFSILNGNTQPYSRLFVLNKANYYAGAVGSYRPFSLTNDLGASIAPTTTYDPNLSTMYLLETWAGNFNGSGYLRLFTITGAVGSEVLNNTSTAAAIFFSTANPWDFIPPNRANFAPQLGTFDKIQVNDSRMQNVVYRNGSLWCAHTIFLPTGGPTRSSIQWWQLNPTSNTILQRGRIDDPTGNFFYAFPSISINRNNDALIGYARFSASQYAGAGYAYRAGTDPANSMRDDTLLRGGGAPYYFADNDGKNRWGDYSGTSVDPANDTDLWTIQEYASTSNNWSTWWGRVSNTGTSAPANNNFGSAQVISGSSGSVTGTNAGATKETGEPNHGGNIGGASVWYQWQAPTSGTMTITTFGSNFDTLLGVYTGSSVGALSLIAGNDDDSLVSGVTSRVTFNAVSGTIYRIAVDGFNGATGSITLNWNLTGSCAYTISPSSTSFTSGGGTGSVTVTAGTGCTWSASSNASWITINSGSSGTGSGSVGYTVSPNTGSISRSGAITVTGQGFTGVHTVTENPPSILTVASSNPASGVSITASPSDISGLGGGTTQFTRTYHNNTSVSLTAPATVGSNSFLKWQRDGADWATTQSTSVTMDVNHTMTAVYNSSSQGRVNVALASNGGIASASSTTPNAGFPSYNFSPGVAIDGDRRGGRNFWRDNTTNTYPDMIQVDFNGSKTINEISVFTVQDSTDTNPLEPTAAQTFTLYGITSFDVQYWNGAAWITVPSGSVIGNNLVWRKFTFADITTSKIRVVVNNALASYSRVVELEAWSTSAQTSNPNFALASNGGIASASSTTPNASFPGYNFLPAVAIDGDRKSGVNFWRDNTDTFPDWLQVDFNGQKSISEIDVYTLQDNTQSPSDPTPSLTFTTNGITAFDVQYWTGVSWVTVPGGSVSGNNLVWRRFTFSAISTSRIRVLVNNALNTRSRIVEVEAYGAVTAPSRSNVALASNGGVANASSTTPNSQFPGYNFLPAVTIDGDRKSGVNFWRDNTANVYPDTLEVTFSGSQTINEIDVFTLQDNTQSPSDPTEEMTFSINGITSFDVQYWTGLTWVTVPGGNIIGNNRVWRKLTFADITTSKIRVVVNNALASQSRVVELEAWSSSTPVTYTNYALASNGGIASASSTTANASFPGYNFLPAVTIDGDRKSGVNFWRDNTDTFPDWLQVDFNGQKSISEIDVYTLQDNTQSPSDPTAAMTFTINGITAFDVQYWTGVSWVTVPGGSVSGNNLVWRRFTFSAISTSRIRVLVNNALNTRSRIVEVEGWGN